MCVCVCVCVHDTAANPSIPFSVASRLCVSDWQGVRSCGFFPQADVLPGESCARPHHPLVPQWTACLRFQQKGNPEGGKQLHP